MKEQSSRLGTENIPKLLLSLSVPAFMGMFLSMLFNIVDTIFIARGVGTLGVAALSIVFPIQALIAVGAATFGVGGASIISRRLGANRTEEANKVFGHMVWFIQFLSVILVIASLLFMEPLLRAFGATDQILPYAADYLWIILLGSLVNSFAAGTNNVVRSEGNAKIAMYTMVIGSLVNVILNPIFIFGLNMGMQGAAIATVIGQGTGAIWLLKYFLSGKSSLRINWIGWKPDLRLVKDIILIGLPAFVMMASTSLMTLSVNWVLVFFGGETHIAIYGIINRIFMFSIMPIYGLVQGMQPIIGFNFGAGLFERVTRTFKIGAYIATVIGTIVWIVVMAVPSLMMKIFSTDPEVIMNGAEAMRWIFLLAPMIGLPMVIGSLYQAIGKAKKSFILSISRIVLLIPFVFTLPQFWGLTGVWISFALVDVLAFSLAAFILVKDRKSVFTIQSIHENKEEFKGIG